MKTKLLTLVAAFTLLASAQAYAQTRVACIGNSITYGAFINNRELNSYPAQLQNLLGEGYEVGNFGSSGAVALFEGSMPYVQTPQYKQSLEYNPNIVIIKLGTNDSQKINRFLTNKFKENYQAIIDSYRKLSSKPRIILVSPLRVYMQEGDSQSDTYIQTKIRPLIEELAYENNLEIIDGYSLFGAEHQQHLMPDSLHPSSIGAGVIALNIYRTLTAERDQSYDIHSIIGKGEPFNFYGFEAGEYQNNGLNYKIVKPKIANKKHSWAIRARFWGHEPQLDLKLLELGFHIAYCDVENLYGAPSAVERWNKFYDMMKNAQLNHKVVIEAMSRGGLIAYNWAAENTEKVSAIYADAPVLDTKSWPMGQGDYAGSDECTQQMCKAYGLTHEQMTSHKHNPIDHATTMAKANIPIIHVIGTEDKIVPTKENTNIFEQRLKQAEGTMTVIRKEGVGHHPHSLKAPEPILKFILKAENLLENMCVKPIRGNEYRPGAGWYNGADWNQTADDISQTLQQQKVDILMLGNSITQGFAVNRELVGSCKNNEELNKIFKPYTWESAGMSGDKTQNLLWRIKNGNYNAAKPQFVSIAIGVNNAEDDAQSVYQGIMAVCNAAMEEMPQAQIILFGMLPTAASEQRLRTFHSVIDMIKQTKLNPRITFVDPREHFADSNGYPLQNLYSTDQIHLVGEGYKVWAKVIADTIRKISASK